MHEYIPLSQFPPHPYFSLTSIRLRADIGGSFAVASRGLFATGVSTDLNGEQPPSLPSGQSSEKGAPADSREHQLHISLRAERSATRSAL